MTRSTVAVTLVALAALLGAWEAAAVYGLAETYADPTASSLHHLVGGAGLALTMLALVAGLAALGVALARGRLHRVLVGVTAAVVVATASGVLLGNHLGVMAKASRAAEPPRCGIADPGLNRAFRALEHHGFFGGGTSSRSHCAHLLSSADTGASLTAYEQDLRAAGWTVGRTADGTLRATRESFLFRVTAGPAGSDSQLEVTLRRMR